MRISDWSSDVCSSDLRHARRAAEPGDAGIFEAPRLRARPAHRGAGARVRAFTAARRSLRARRVRQPARLVEPQAEVRLQADLHPVRRSRSEEHTSELQSLMRISYAVFCLKTNTHTTTSTLLP